MQGDEPSFRLGHILYAIDRISKYTHAMTFDAVVRNLEIIGEAARNIPEDVRSRYSQILAVKIGSGRGSHP